MILYFLYMGIGQYDNCNERGKHKCKYKEKYKFILTMDVVEGRGSKFPSIDDERGGDEICVN